MISPHLTDDDLLRFIQVEALDEAQIEIDPETGYAKGPFLAETYPVSVDRLNVVLDLP